MEFCIMFLLGFTSIVSLTVIIERSLALRWARIIPPNIKQAVESCSADKEFAGLRETCDAHPSPIGRLILVAASHRECPKIENIDAMQTKARHEVAKLERGLVVLEIITGIAPLLGLVGTIFGLILLFNSMGRGGTSADQSEFATGIALALNATLMGLLVAIPSLVFWSYLTKKVENLAIEMETICDEFVQRIYRTKL